MPMTTRHRYGNITQIKWDKVMPEERLNDVNVSKAFDMGGRLLQEESTPPAGCIQCTQKMRHVKLLVKEGLKSGKIKIHKEKCLGKGGFGVISLATLKARNNDGKRIKTKIAVKTISHEALRRRKHNDDNIVTMIKDEVKSMIRCQHTNIIGLQFVIIYRDETLIGLELAAHGPLQRHFSKNSKVTCMQWCTKIMDAIHHCHTRGVMHLDIKPENILLDDHFNIKIADFGLSEVVKDMSTLNEDAFVIPHRAGTRVYMAPEMFYGKTRNGKKCDVWSLGVTMYEMLLNRRPFDDDKLKSIVTKVKNMRIDRKSDTEIQQYLEDIFDINKVYFPPDFPIEPKVIICAMLNFDPIKRPNLEQIINLSWISKFRE